MPNRLGYSKKELSPELSAADIICKHIAEEDRTFQAITHEAVRMGLKHQGPYNGFFIYHSNKHLIKKGFFTIPNIFDPDSPVVDLLPIGDISYADGGFTSDCNTFHMVATENGCVILAQVLKLQNMVDISSENDTTTLFN